MISIDNSDFIIDRHVDDKSAMVVIKCSMQNNILAS